MATAGDIKYNVTCGVLEEGKNITLMYTIPDPLKSITWDWVPNTAADGSKSYVAQMVGSDSQRGHQSRPIPEDIHKKLGSKAQKSRENKYFKVKLMRKDEVSIEEFFNKS